MSAQTTYGFATAHGVAGTIYDLYHYPIDSRSNEEETGKLAFGMGVVKGTTEGSTVVLPTAASTAAQFEGVVVNGYNAQHDLEGKVFLMNNQSVGVMRKGRIWVQLATGAAPKYGDELHLVVDGTDAGRFTTTGGVTIAGRFLGAADNGVAPAEIDG